MPSFFESHKQDFGIILDVTITEIIHNGKPGLRADSLFSGAAKINDPHNPNTKKYSDHYMLENQLPASRESLCENLHSIISGLNNDLKAVLDGYSERYKHHNFQFHEIHIRISGYNTTPVGIHKTNVPKSEGLLNFNDALQQFSREMTTSQESRHRSKCTIL